jgi:hypothetical protein
VVKPVVDLLRKLDWDVETAKQAKLTGKMPDVVWVIYARDNHRIGITFDEIRAKQGLDIASELKLRGGKVIRIQGGPAQHPFRAIGKLLFHYEDWNQFFNECDGVCVISDTNKPCRNCTPEQYIQFYHHLNTEQFNKYLNEYKKRPYIKRRRNPPPIADEQQPLA